jgi:hypothetical protein
MQLSDEDLTSSAAFSAMNHYVKQAAKMANVSINIPELKLYIPSLKILAMLERAYVAERDDPEPKGMGA